MYHVYVAVILVDCVYTYITLPDLERSLAKNKLFLPGEVDYTGAVKAIVRLQLIYQLPTTDIISGVIKGQSASGAMDLKDMYNFGMEGLVHAPQLALSWFSSVLASVGIYEQGFDCEELIGFKDRICTKDGWTFDLKEVLQHVAQAYEQVGIYLANHNCLLHSLA